MNVSKFFHELRFIPNIEIVVALLPEMLSLADQSPRYSLFQRLYRVGESLLARLAEQQVNVFGHDHITVDAKFETEAHPLQRGLKNLPGDGCRERGTTMVTAEGHEVSLPGRVKSFQSPRHEASLRRRSAPLEPKNGLNRPPNPVFPNSGKTLSSPLNPTIPRIPLIPLRK